MKKLHSLSELKGYKGAKEREDRTPREMKCRLCGAPMRHIEGTNVYICTGVNEKGEACENRAIKGVHSQM